MEVKQIKTKNLALLSAITLVASFFIVSFIMSQVADADAEITKYRTNADGLSYGTVFEAPPWGELPDLVAVEATNGKMGFAYRHELIGSPPADDRGEAARYMDEKFARNSMPFVRHLSEELSADGDVKVVIDADAEAARKAYDIAYDYTSYSMDGKPILDGDVVRRDIAGILGIDVELLPQGEEFYRLLELSLGLAANDFYVEIPVYLEDGKTQIGVFRAGA